MSSESRIGVFLCHPADSAQGPVDLQAVADYAKQLPGVIEARVMVINSHLDPELLADEIAGINVVVLGGYSPGFYKAAFTQALSLDGGNPEQVRLASFRENGVTANHALQRAKAVVACAVYGVPFSLAANRRAYLSTPTPW